jgi:ubiquitin carboxyl-terminal hydrolase 36/42
MKFYKNKELYDLYGIVVHLGDTPRSGHYISFIKASDNNWYECNDSIIRKCTKDNIL